MLKGRKMVFAVACAMAHVAISGDVETWHVDARAAAGGDGSVARPFASPAAALAARRTAVKKPGAIRFAAGDYYLEKPLELDAREAGLVLLGEGRVRFLRAERLVPKSTSATGVSSCVVDCAAAQPPDAEGFGQVRAHLPLVFFDGNWAVEARWPNAGFATFTEAVDSGIRGRCLNGVAPDNTPVAGSFRFDDARAAKWDYADGVWLCGYFTHDWAWERIRAAAYDTSTNAIVMAAPATFGICGQTWSSEPARRFYAVARAELDAPGEYWFDRRTKTVELIAPEGTQEILAVTNPGWLVIAQNVTNVSFRNIAFEYALDGAIRAKNCDGLEIADCRVGNVGGEAIQIEGGRNCRILRTKIAGCGRSGVTVSGGERRRLVPAGHVVADCEIADYGRINRTYSPGVHVWGVGVTVRGNRIHDAPHTGVMYWGNDHRIERNEIWNLLYECGDAGAVYTGRDPTSRGNLLRFNYIHDCGHRGRKTANMMAFYVDDCDCGDTFVSNRVVNVPRGLLLGGGQDNHLIGNVFEQCDIGVSIDNRGLYDGGKFDSKTDASWQMTRKVKEVPVGEEPWKSRYPLLVTYLSERPREPIHNSIVGNVFRDCRQPIEYWLEGNPNNREDLELRDNRFETVKDWKFPRATPESQGIPRANVQKLLERIEAEGDRVHGYMLIRHGKVVAEGWRTPYGAGTRHALFSVSKSFVSMALGLAIEEGKMALEDCAGGIFPSATMDAAKLAQLHRKATGLADIVNYLEPRVFEKLGIGDQFWARQPDGTVKGDTGFELCTEDLAKVCQLLLDGGCWRGERILPNWWVKRMVAERDAFGPGCIVMPDKDMVFVSTADGDGANGRVAAAFCDTCLAAEGETPFWNEYAFMFMHAPAFSFTNVAGAVNYRFEATDEGRGKWTFTARSPQASLAPVWDALPVGVVKVVCRGIGSDGRDCGVAGARTFWRKAAFKGDEKAYPPAKRSYAETAKMILDYQFGRDEMKRIVRGEKPTWHRFPTKQLAAIVSAAARRAKFDPASRGDSLAVLRGAADYLLAISAPADSPLAHFTPTYRADETHPDWKGKTMLIYPADGANAMLDAYAATGEAKYLAAAKGACETFMRMQGKDGSWPLVVSLADGRALTTNRCLTTRHVALFDRLFKLTGDARYRAAGDRAFGYIERGPLATWNWEGQFEDTPPTAPYMNLTKHDACSVAIYLTERHPDDARRRAQARALLRFAEDLFVNWEKPFAGGRVLMPEKGRGYYNHYWDQDKWCMPSVFEQYGCYTPVDASAAKLIRTYLALWRVGHDSADLAKARVLGNMITRMTDDDGLESTWWNEKDRRKDIWPNCMLACEAALEELSSTGAVGERIR